jgi:hypothetical protein
MRRDTSKAIVERPRPGSSRHVPCRYARLDPKHIVLDEDGPRDQEIADRDDITACERIAG